MAKKTVNSFEKVFNNTDSYYIFYVDDDNYMRFLADVDSVNVDASDLNDAIYTDNMVDAVLCTYEQATTLKFLCNYLFPNHHHIVNVHTTVEWK